MSCGVKDGGADVGACGATGFREQSRVVRSDDAGSWRGLHGLAVRVEPAGWRHDPHHLRPYFSLSFLAQPGGPISFLSFAFPRSPTLPTAAHLPLSHTHPPTPRPHSSASPPTSSQFHHLPWLRRLSPHAAAPPPLFPFPHRDRHQCAGAHSPPRRPILSSPETAPPLAIHGRRSPELPPPPHRTSSPSLSAL
jgi:hypothetical protein